MENSSVQNVLNANATKRLRKYSEFAETNVKDIQQLLTTYCNEPEKEIILNKITKFLEDIKLNGNIKLELPPMQLGLLSLILQNCSLYAGNIQAMKKGVD